MNVVVTARHAEVSSDLREITRKKVAHLERFASDMRLVEVDFSDMASRRSVDAHICEILIHLKRQLVKGVASGPEQPVALDLAIEKVTQQLRRLHERRLDGRHGGPHRNLRDTSARAAAGNGQDADDLTDLDLDLGPDADRDGDSVRLDDSSLQVVKTKRFETKPMEIEEATLQMELLGHDFFLFTNSETGRASVLYRRRDGRLGLIEATG
jgi:putative sigma-54 modulation protein